MLKEKAKNFVLINMVSKPVLMLLGLLSSIFVVRRLGPDQYASIVILQALKGTISMLMGLGLSATLTKLWVKYDNPNKLFILYLIYFYLYNLFYTIKTGPYLFAYYYNFGIILLCH
jgi:hypothetical protein